MIIGMAFSLQAQRVCQTPEYYKQIMAQAPASLLGTIGQGAGRDTVRNEILVVPVVIHVLYRTAQENISPEQIASQIAILNQDFRRRNPDKINTPEAFRNVAADAGITFCLARTDPMGRPTSGVIRKYTGEDYFMMDDKMKFAKTGGDNAWDPTKYLNIWVCNLGNRNLGYASLPGGPADKDGVVINCTAFGNTGIARAPFNKGRTSTHEIAHWLGLKHIWGDNRCASDGIDDTPAQEGYNFYCPSFPHMSSCSPDANGDMFMNFMDFTDDACMNMFTKGQAQEMRGQFALNMARNSFLNSFVCDSALASGAPVTDTIPAPRPVFSAQVFPNPVTNFIRLKIEGLSSLEGLQVTLLDALGRKLWMKTVNEKVTEFPSPALVPGIYYLRLTGPGTLKVLKVVKIN
ncbi:MAG: M43 family zinc metalloprotease [Ferruginibacter sp.]